MQIFSIKMPLKKVISQLHRNVALLSLESTSAHLFSPSSDLLAKIFVKALIANGTSLIRKIERHCHLPVPLAFKITYLIRIV